MYLFELRGIHKLRWQDKVGKWYWDNNNNTFAIVQSTVSDLLKDSPMELEWKSPGVKQ